MKLKIAKFESIAEIVETQNPDDWRHPLLVEAKFVFLDDKPNSNNQGVQAEDFDEIIRSSIGVPVKMKYLGTVAGHSGSIPIGHIKSMTKDTTEDGTNRLIATAALYAEEFPAEIDFLKEAHDKGEAPGVSFELLYSSEASIIKEGITWLKKIITKAATFVGNPAYGKRTALMAIASDNSLSDEEFNSAILQWAEQQKNIEGIQGGSTMTEQEIKELLEKLAAAEARVVELTAAKEADDIKIGELNTSLAEVTQINKNLEAEVAEGKKKTLIAERTAKMVEAGFKLDPDPEKAAVKQEIWVGLSDEAFASILEDFIEAKKAVVPARAEAHAGARVSLIPRPTIDPTVKPLTLTDVRAGFKGLSRSEASEG